MPFVPCRISNNGNRKRLCRSEFLSSQHQPDYVRWHYGTGKSVFPYSTGNIADDTFYGSGLVAYGYIFYPNCDCPVAFETCSGYADNAAESNHCRFVIVSDFLYYVTSY